MLYRKPTFDDVEAIYELVNDYAKDGVMLARSRNTLYETLRDMVVAEENGIVVGVGGLHITWNELAEIRTMAILPSAVGRGIGKKIVQLLLEEAKVLGVKEVFTLTYKPGFFQTLNFVEISKDALPHKVWKDCIDCAKFPNCDEIAMKLLL
ncbi:MAG: N-acetyltransferase [Selenomonadaceae bacterium]